jgi:hypothetical protein
MKKALFIGCLVFLVVGCGEKPRATSTSTQSPSKTTQLAKGSTETSSVGQNQIKLVNAGAEPRQQLRFAPPANTKQTLQMTMNMNMAMSVEGQAQRTLNSPPIQMTMEAQVKKVDDNGDIHADFTYSDADVVAGANTSPEMVNAMRSQIKQLVGLSGSMLIDQQGNIKQVNLNLPEGLDPNTKRMVEQMANSLRQISSPFPSEAVGVGAKWQLPNTVTANGMTLNQTATYELVGLQDNVATLEISVEQQAESQKVNPPGLPAGASIDLKSLSSQGNGKVKRALNQIMPINSNISVRSDAQMTVKDASSQKETTMGMNSAMEIILESK